MLKILYFLVSLAAARRGKMDGEMAGIYHVDPESQDDTQDDVPHHRGMMSVVSKPMTPEEMEERNGDMEVANQFQEFQDEPEPVDEEMEVTRTAPVQGGTPGSIPPTRSKSEIREGLKKLTASAGALGALRQAGATQVPKPRRRSRAEASLSIDEPVIKAESAARQGDIAGSLPPTMSKKARNGRKHTHIDQEAVRKAAKALRMQGQRVEEEETGAGDFFEDLPNCHLHADDVKIPLQKRSVGENGHVHYTFGTGSGNEVECLVNDEDAMQIDGAKASCTYKRHAVTVKLAFDIDEGGFCWRPQDDEFFTLTGVFYNVGGRTVVGASTQCVPGELFEKKEVYPRAVFQSREGESTRLKTGGRNGKEEKLTWEKRHGGTGIRLTIAALEGEIEVNIYCK